MRRLLLPVRPRGVPAAAAPPADAPAGGVVLGALAALGGHLTLFKGLDEITVLAADPGGWSAGQFATMTVVKLAALLVAASCGFRGGRIFPAVFVGTALGLCAHALVPGCIRRSVCRRGCWGSCWPSPARAG
ncbi:chloride channel protein [Streptomyces sp. INA 01156]